MQARELEALAAEVVQFTKMAITPVLARVATLERELKAANDRCVELDAMAIAPLVARITVLEGQKALAPLAGRDVSELEQRILELETHPAPIAMGPAGPMGHKGDPGPSIASLVVSAEGRLLAHFTDGRSLDAGPVPRGADGVSVTVADLSGVISSEVDKVFVADRSLMVDDVLKRIPQPKDGAPGPPGERGQDAQAPDIDAIVTRVVGLVLPPERGEKGETGERGPAGITGDSGLTGERGPQGERGSDGKDGESTVGIPGRDGIDGKSVDMDEIKTRVDLHLVQAIAALQVPKDGKDGAPGADGRSVTLEDVTPFITRELEQRIATLPIAKDGIGFTGAVVTREGHLVMTLSNGATQDVGSVIGKDGAPGLDGKDAVGTPGINGKDGLGFDNFDMELDQTRGWILRLFQGDRVKEWELGIPFDARIWAAGLIYPKGAGVTWDGHYWIAQEPTTDPPGEGSPAWRLAVRRGKQGREGKQGKDGSAGRDLTQMDPATGRKW